MISPLLNTENPIISATSFAASSRNHVLHIVASDADWRVALASWGCDGSLAAAIPSGAPLFSSMEYLTGSSDSRMVRDSVS